VAFLLRHGHRASPPGSHRSHRPAAGQENPAASARCNVSLKVAGAIPRLRAIALCDNPAPSLSAKSPAPSASLPSPPACSPRSFQAKGDTLRCHRPGSVAQGADIIPERGARLSRNRRRHHFGLRGRLPSESSCRTTESEPQCDLFDGAVRIALHDGPDLAAARSWPWRNWSSMEAALCWSEE